MKQMSASFEIDWAKEKLQGRNCVIELESPGED
jgi:hypothetical protein